MFRINQRSAQPIYEQILENVETLIINGVLLKDEQLPSVRSVARDLAVNPNTIQKAYGLLEERGIIYSRPGRGSLWRWTLAICSVSGCRRLLRSWTRLWTACGRWRCLWTMFWRVCARDFKKKEEMTYDHSGPCE